MSLNATQERLLTSISRALHDKGTDVFVYMSEILWMDVGHAVEIDGKSINHEYDLLFLHSFVDFDALVQAGCIEKIAESEEDEITFHKEVTYRLKKIGHSLNGKTVWE